ncbi:MAG: NADPH:quinone oxidoreductase family protein [Myxococcota bacterium]|nr:NADPH:quinone oxidoreductase family protein [Myxococcota bacterium]
MSGLDVKPNGGYKVIVDGLSDTPTDGIRDHLKVVEQPFPNLDALADHDVVIAVRCAGLSWVDLLMLSGQYQHMPTLPYTPGLEYSGTIVWLGPDVDRTMFDLGQSVFVDCFSVGPRTSGPYQAYGGMASYAVAPASAVRAMPDQFTFEQACNYAGNYETAYHCLVACGHLCAGETVLVHGASGATGVAAVQIAKHLGATVIATGRSIHKLNVIKSLGADHIIPIGYDDGRPGVRRFRDDIKALTDGAGVDVVYDGVGGDVSIESLRCVRFGARFLIVGWASTPDVAKGRGGRGAPRANQLPTNLILMKGLRVLGCPTVIATQKDPTIRDERVVTLDKWVRAGALRPYVSHQFNIHEVAEAFEAKWRGDVIGGCIINPAPASDAHPKNQ